MTCLFQTLDECDLWREELNGEIPRRWEKHGDLALLPRGSFHDVVWSSVPRGEEFFSRVANILSACWLARRSEGPAAVGGKRTPDVTVIYDGRKGRERGSTWAKKTENGIVYAWDIKRCMFSSGNVNEKMRLANLDCSNEVVVDLVDTEAIEWALYYYPQFPHFSFPASATSPCPTWCTPRRNSCTPATGTRPLWTPSNAI